MQQRIILPSQTCSPHFLSLTLLVYISILTSITLTLAPKLYLSAAQSSILLPQLFIDQTIHTQYTIQGTSITIHQPLQIIQRYNKDNPLSMLVNSMGQALVGISHAVPDVMYMYYISADSYGHFCHIGRNLEERATFYIDWSQNIQHIQLVKQHEVIIWSNRIMGVLRISPSQNNTYTHELIKMSLPLSFALSINKCSYFKQNSYICFTNQNIIQIQQIKTQQNSSSSSNSQLLLKHILTPKQELKCLINIYRLEDNLIALCDCDKGCYNYRIIGNQLQVIVNIQMINSQRIIVMKETEGGPKTVTMAVASQNILALMRWGQQQIIVVDSMLLPDVQSGQLWDIQVSGDNICLMYRNQANPTFITFEHIFIRYDSIRLQYDQLNSIIEGPYIYPFRRLLYHIGQNNVLNLRLTNPYNIKVDYQPNPRSITIKAFNTGKKAKLNKSQFVYSDEDYSNETVQILINSVKINEVYLKENISREIQMNYQYTYPMELYQIFIGRVQQFVLTQKFIPLSITDTYKQDRKVLNNFQDYRILSIYNLLQCIRLINVGGWTFKRMMTSPNNKIYIQQCKSQKTQNNGDFICQIKQIVDSIFDVKLMNRSSWKMKDIAIENSKAIFEIWSDNEMTTIVTKYECHSVLYDSSMSYIILPSNHLLLSTHNTTTLTLSLLSFNTITNSSHRIQSQLHIHLPFILNTSSATTYNKLTDINYQLKYQNSVWWQYKVGIGYRTAFNHTIVFVIKLRVQKQYKTYINMGKLQLDRLIQIDHYSAYFRMYSDYLYSFNSTHVIKYSLLSLNAYKLYTHQLQIRLGNPLQFVRSVGQYMLLVYVHSYKILNLQGQLIQLIIDDQLILNKSLLSGNSNQLGNVGIYDIIIFGSGTLFLGINNVMRAYDRNLLFTIGPYPMQIGRIRTHHALTLCAYPPTQQQQQQNYAAITLNFNLTVDYETTLIETRGKAIKMLKHLPFTTVNETVIVWQNMFTGPIQQYYIADLYDGAVVLLNHIQKLYDTDSGDIKGPINRWITIETTKYLSDWSYKLLYQVAVDHAKNTDSSNHVFVYANHSHVAVVFLSSGKLEIQVALPGWEDCQKFNYFAVSENKQFILASKNCIAYVSPSKQQNRLQTYTATTLNIAIKYNHQILQFSPTATTIYLILNQTIKQHSQISANITSMPKMRKGEQFGKLASINYQQDPSTVRIVNSTSVTAIRGIQEVVFYIGKMSVQTDYDRFLNFTSDDFLCIMSIQMSLKNCTRLSDLIPAAYYKSQPDSYIKIVSISLNRLLLLSRHSSSYHLEIVVKWTLTNEQIEVQWQIMNCYVGLPAYQVVEFIGMYVNGSNYDYFVLQYRQIDSTHDQHSDKDQRTETVFAFYRFNDQFDRYCGNVAAWVEIGNQAAAIANIADPQFYPEIQHQSLMFTSEQVFHLYKNLSFVLSYNQPPTTRYTVIYARNPQFSNKFYSKLSYQPDPNQAYFWIYCWVGFGCVALILLIIKIISVLIDRGVIRLSSSLSSDDDSVGSPGVTVHFSSGGMLTQQNSYKSMDA